jgi:hypothetical protein
MQEQHAMDEEPCGWEWSLRVWIVGVVDVILRGAPSVHGKF